VIASSSDGFSATYFTDSNKILTDSKCGFIGNFTVAGDCSAADATYEAPSWVHDPYWSAQIWYMELINVKEAWDNGYTGLGIQIQFNDDGVDDTHPDFKGRISTADSCDVYASASSGEDQHGTHCAGFAAASANQNCTVGVAPGVTLASCNIFANYSYSADFYEQMTTDLYLAISIENNDISSNSWGIDACTFSSDDDGRRRHLEDADSSCPFLSDPDDSPCSAVNCSDWSTMPNIACDVAISAYCEDDSNFDADADACEDYLDLWSSCEYNSLSSNAQSVLRGAVNNGRNGLGTIYVFAAGNEYTTGDDVNFEGYLNSRFTITVGAVGHEGYHSSYSSQGAAVHVSAPGGDIEYVHNMVTAFPIASGKSCGDATMGTSFATPVVSGVAALILEANPGLGWRDVQGILANTSQMVDSSDADWVINSAGFHHSYKYGFGLIDAGAATSLAVDWVNWAKTKSFTKSMYPSETIEDAFSDDTPGATVTSTVTFSDVLDFVEHAEVYLTCIHPRRGDLEVVLTSPSGVTSLLAMKRPEDSHDYSSFKFMTLRNWGEPAEGSWSLSVTDMNADTYDDDDDTTATFTSWKLQLHGHGYDTSDDSDDESDVPWWVILLSVLVVMVLAIYAGYKFFMTKKPMATLETSKSSECELT